MPRVKGTPVNYDCDKDNHNTVKNNDTFKESPFIPEGSMVALQCEDGGPWTHDIVRAWEDTNHNDGFYKIQLTRRRHIITRNI